eukprot:2448765-Pleurochrysis_carterae.AAC.3
MPIITGFQSSPVACRTGLWRLPFTLLRPQARSNAVNNAQDHAQEEDSDHGEDDDLQADNDEVVEDYTGTLEDDARGGGRSTGPFFAMNF